MKINELKRIAEENDYEFSRKLGYFCLNKRNHTNNIDIRGDVENRIWISTGVICDDRDFNMIKASVKFAETPPDEREEEKKYYLRHRWLEKYYARYLNLSDDDYNLDTKCPSLGVSTQFTLKEIDEIKERFDTDLSDFELVEVEE